MPRKVDITTSIPCQASALWAAVYANAEPTVQYHEAVNQDPAANVGAWKDGRRCITFCMPLNAPDWVGIDAVRVKEHQAVVWHSTGSFSVQSETTVLNVPGASRFVTTLHLSVREVQGHHELSAATCEVTFTVCCSAGMPWPLSTSIENIMADRAQISMQGYLDYCHSLVTSSPPDTTSVPPEPHLALSLSGPSGSAAASSSFVHLHGEATAAARRAEMAGGSSSISRQPFRWPSVAVSSFSQDVEQLIPVDESVVGGDDSFHDACQWLSPTTSFSPLEYASDTEGAHQGAAAGGSGGEEGHARPRVTQLVDVATGQQAAYPAELAHALSSLAAAVQALDRKLTYIASHMALDDPPDRGHTAQRGGAGPGAARQPPTLSESRSLHGWLMGPGFTGEGHQSGPYQHLPAGEGEQPGTRQTGSWRRVLVLLVVALSVGLGWVLWNWQLL